MTPCLKNIPDSERIVVHTGNKGLSFPISLPCDTVVWSPEDELCYLAVEDATVGFELSALGNSNPFYFEDSTTVAGATLALLASAVDVSSLGISITACFAAPCIESFVEEEENTGVCSLLHQNGLIDILCEDNLTYFLVACR